MIVSVPKLGFFAGLVPGARAKRAARIASEEAHASEVYLAQSRKYSEILDKRNSALSKATEEVNEYNAEVEQFAAAVAQGDAESVARYFELIFEESEYPYEFANEYKVAWDLTSKHLVVDCRLPTSEDVIPEVEKYKYSK